MPPAAFEPAIHASERPQTHALDQAATGIGPTLDIPPQIAVNHLALYRVLAVCVCVRVRARARARKTRVIQVVN